MDSRSSAACTLTRLAAGLVERGYMDSSGRRRQLALDLAWDDAKERCGILRRDQFDATLAAAGYQELLEVAQAAIEIAERKVYAALDQELDPDLLAIERMRATVLRLGGGE